MVRLQLSCNYATWKPHQTQGGIIYLHMYLWIFGSLDLPVIRRLHTLLSLIRCGDRNNGQIPASRTNW